MHTGLTQEEELAVISGLHQFHEYFPEREIVSSHQFYECSSERGIRNYGDGWYDEKYSSADRYVRNAKRAPSGQIDAYDLILQMMEDPWQKKKKHIDVLFVGEDLTACHDGEWLNFCFGRTCGRFTIQSVARFRQLGRYDKALAIKSLLWHELGHVIGMAGNLMRKRTTDALGSHCTSRGCVMQQGMTVEDFLGHAKEAAKIGRIYCSLCMKDARNSLY